MRMGNDLNPYISVEGFAGISFFFLCAFFVLVRTNRTKSFQPIDFTIMTMGIFYGCIFPIVIFGAHNGAFFGAEFINNANNFSLINTFAAFIAVIALYVGWRSVPQKMNEKFNLFFLAPKPKKIILWLYVMTLLAIATQYLYTRAYGGFLGYFGYNLLIRSGHFDLIERSQFSFLKPFGSMAVFASLGFWGLILSRFRGVLVWIGFLLSLSFSVYYLAASAGRLSWVILVATIITSIMKFYRVNFLTWFAAMLVSTPLALFSTFVISDLFDLKAAENIVYFITTEASFPFTGFFANLEAGFLYHSFVEVLLSPVYLLPSSLYGSLPFNASQINTEIIHGARKEVGGTTSGMPTDILTFGLMQFHLIGVAVYAFLFGVCLRLISSLASSFTLRGMSVVYVSYVIIRIAIFGLFYSQPQHLIVTNFAAIFVVLTVLGLRLFRQLLLSRNRHMRL